MLAAIHNLFGSYRALACQALINISLEFRHRRLKITRWLPDTGPWRQAYTQATFAAGNSSWIRELSAWVSLALLFTCGTAQAAQWVAVGQTNNGELLAFVDLSSLSISGYTRRAWFKYVYAPRSQRDDRVNKWNKVSFSQETFNCANETSRIEALNGYDEDGTQWSVPAALLPTSWTLIGPRTVRDFERRFLCT